MPESAGTATLRERCAGRRTPPCCCAAVRALALLAAAGTPASPAWAAAALKVGTLTLHACETPAPWCGSLERPLDPGGAVPGRLSVYFEYYPHTGSGPATGTLVATEGGPGYPATGSRAGYLELYAPLRTHRDVLIMDNRGTGRSAAIDCEPLQNAPALTEAGIGACGRSLGRTAPLYSSALAADDLAAILKAMSIDRIDLYGDSYGTYFSQVFALRHPERLRSLVLDGAYPLEGPDYPWWPHYAPAMREKFNRACERSPACRAIPGSSLEHIAPALERLRAAPFSAEARYGVGEPLRFTANAGALAIVMFGGSPAHATVRELDAAARAFAGGDRAPLLRLMAEALTSTDSRDPTHSPQLFSAGLAAAISCGDPPQIFDMTLAPEARLIARDAAIGRRKAEAPGTYAPFTIDEYRAMPLDYAFIDQCVQWPGKDPRSPAVPLVPTGARYPEVPVLVVSGELDNMTNVADGAAAAAHFPRARHVVIANSFHVNALPHARSGCGATLVRRFIERLIPGDESCAAAVPAVRLVPRFAQRLGELPAARALTGNGAGEEALRAVTAALLACGDSIVRAEANGPGNGVGLRGGTFTARASPAGYRLELDGLLWTSDLAVSGEIDWPRRSGTAHAQLKLHGSQDVSGTLELSWPEGVPAARARARGTLGGATVLAEAPAP